MEQLLTIIVHIWYRNIKYAIGMKIMCILVQFWII